MLDIARRLDGVELETVTGKKFTVGVYMECPFFVPKSTGRGRSDGRKAAERFLERFNETGSLRTTDYQDATRNASYFLPLVMSRRAFCKS